MRMTPGYRWRSEGVVVVVTVLAVLVAAINDNNASNYNNNTTLASILHNIYVRLCQTVSMAEREIYKEKVITHHTNGDREVREDVHIVHEGPGVEHVYHDDRRERRRNLRTRGTVRREILSFRRGIYLLFDIVTIILVAEFFVRLFGFSPANPIVALIDALSYPFLAPFGSILTFVTPFIAINWSILIAIIVYGIFAYLVVALFESGIRAAYRR